MYAPYNDNADGGKRQQPHPHNFAMCVVQQTVWIMWLCMYHTSILGRTYDMKIPVVAGMCDKRGGILV